MMMQKNANRKVIVWVVLLVGITFIAYGLALFNGFLFFDDPVYILENPSVHAITFDHIRQWFTTAPNGTYVPLTLFTWAIEYHFVGDAPMLYIVNNILLHVANVLLVFWFVNQVFKNTEMSFVAALVFALHPMHVESVAWITERKDVLYAFFFLLSLNFYVKDALSGQNGRKYYIVSLVFFVLSLFSKGQAVVLPFFLLVTDLIIKQHPFSIKNLVEKVPFFLLSLLVGLLALNFQGLLGSQAKLYHYDTGTNLLLISASWAKYVYLTLVPILLSPIHPLPVPGEPLPFWIIISPLFGILFLGLLYITYRKNKPVFVAIALYFFGVVFMLNHASVGKALIAERFVYISLLGFGIFIGLVFNWLKKKTSNTTAYMITGLYLLILGGITFHQTTYWKNETRLFGLALQHYPKNPEANAYLASHYISEGEAQKAKKYVAEGLKQFPIHPLLINSLGSITFQEDRVQDALQSFQKAYKLTQEEESIPYHLGITYFRLDDYEKTLQYQDKALAINPNYTLSYCSKAIALARLGRFDEGLAAADKALQLSPEEPEAYYAKGHLYLSKADFDRSLYYFNKAIELAPKKAYYYVSRGQLKMIYMNNPEGGIADFEKAVILNPGDATTQNDIGAYYAQKQQFDKALSHFEKAYAYDPFSPNIVANYAMALYHKGETDKATTVIREAVGRQVDLPEIVLQIGGLAPSKSAQ